MRIKRVLAAAIIAAGAATALAAPAAADEQLDQTFLTALKKYGVRVGGDAQAIGLAHSMCGVLNRSADVQAAVYHVQRRTKLSDRDVTRFAGLAARAYCPDQLPK